MNTRTANGPQVVVLSSLFPSSVQPGTGLFVRERMFRVGSELPLSVVAPTAWFPFQAWIRRFRPAFRPGAPVYQAQSGFDVWYPRFLSVPGVLKSWDSWFMALGAYSRLRALRHQGRLDLIDAHFAYPDGHAASLLARWLSVPFTVTLRGTESRHALDRRLAPRLSQVLRSAAQVFCVSDSLRQVALGLGADPAITRVVGNGVDLGKFEPVDRMITRNALGIAADAKVLVTVGGLVERKGFHRVIEAMPALLGDFPDLHYLIVGGPSLEGDWRHELRLLVDRLGLQRCVHFLGPQPTDVLKNHLCAADVFVLSSRNEGWANVLLEAMACGLPVVATDVGGNAEVVNAPELGAIVPFDDKPALLAALRRALRAPWDRAAIRRYAEDNTWDQRIKTLVQAFQSIAATRV